MKIQLALLVAGAIAITQASYVYSWNELTEPVPTSTNFYRVAHSYNGDIYGKISTSDDSIWYYTGGSWYQYQGFSGYAIENVNNQGQLMLSYSGSYATAYFTFSKGQATKIPYTGIYQNTVMLTEGPNNSTWTCDSSNQRLNYLNQTTMDFETWTDLPGCNFAIDKSGTPYVIVNNQFKVWDYNLNAWKILSNIPQSNTLLTIRDGSIMMWTTNNTLQIYNTYYQQWEEVFNATAIGMPDLYKNPRMVHFLSRTNFIIAGGLGNSKTYKNYILIPKTSYSEEKVEESFTEEYEFLN